MKEYVLCIDVYQSRSEERNSNICCYVHVGARAGMVPSRITKKLRYLIGALTTEIYFWNETPHVSDSSSVHHQEFFTVHTAMVYVLQVC